MTTPRVSLGELRPSQLLHTFGIGSIVDLPHFSVMVMGIEDWDRSRVRPIVEDRLLAQVRRQLGDQVQGLCSPPMKDEAMGFLGPIDREVAVGVPVAPFPRWVRCPACERLLVVGESLVRLKLIPGRPDLAKYVHENCNRASQPTVLPARFLLACAAGHLDDFPWHWYVHKGQDGCRGGEISLRELGVSGEAADVEVSCGKCQTRRRMVEAFGSDAHKNLPMCRGRRPHLRDFEESGCPADARRTRKTILLGASNSWFSVSLTTLYLPPAAGDRLAQMVDESWSQLANVDSELVLSYLRKQGQLGSLAEWPDAELLAVIERRRASGGEASSVEGDLKSPEWRALTQEEARDRGRDFLLRDAAPPPRWRRFFRRIVLADRLRAVTAIVAFTRIASPRDYAEEEEVPARIRAPLSRNPPQFVPATEVRGEGVFLQLDERTIASWCARQKELERGFRQAHANWRRRRAIAAPEANFPGVRFVLLHSFAHALMRELALECGYTAASLRERIYARDPEDEGGAMAGVLISTSAPDSEGTLGGLVRMGEPEELDRHIGRALESMRLCSSDPLCADHVPEPEGLTLHGAACHACLFAPETSCERGNKYLDRSTLVATVRGSGDPFFVGAE